MREFFIVSCTRGRKEETDLYGSLRKLGTDHFLIIEDNKKGLSTCYNSVLDERAGRDEIVIFVHDDVTIGDLFIYEKLDKAFVQLGYAIAGLAGSSIFVIDHNIQVTNWAQSPKETWSGGVEHRWSESTMMNAYGLTPMRCVVMDGLFLAVDLKRVRHIRFDEQFAFHFYDLDFCLTAHLAGLVLGTVNVYVTHRSHGGYSSQMFKETQLKFYAKWKPGQYELTSQAKHRRNELCYCGSGLRYKHCHGK
jgi:GT2 family glycosyltransferase